MINLKKHAAIALVYFFIVALLGLLLRLFFVVDIDLNFRHFLHAHSHTALLGWVYFGLTTLIYKLFLEKAEKPKRYKRIFYATNISVLGMLISFPFQGYALFSITFSCLFLLSSYWFTWFCLKYIPQTYQNRFSWKLIRAALFYLIFSSLGTWAIGPVVAIKGLTSSLFNNSLYFFLHFLSNGWFYLTLLGVFFYILEQKGIEMNHEQLDKFYAYFNIGVVLSFFLSVLWVKPPIIFYILGSVGAIYQIVAAVILYREIKPYFQNIKSWFKPHSYQLLVLAGSLFCFKLILQLVSATPYIANLAFQYRDFIIGYLHLEFLGIVVVCLFIFLQYFKLITLSKRIVNLFLIAFFSTEILIFYNAIAMWLSWPTLKFHYYILAGLTVLLPVSIGYIAIENLREVLKPVEKKLHQ